MSRKSCTLHVLPSMAAGTSKVIKPAKINDTISNVALINKLDADWWRYQIISHKTLHSVGWTKFLNGVYGFSAFWDNRIGESGIFARLIGIVHRNISMLIKLKCIVKNEDNEIAATLFYHIIEENHEKNHAAVMFICTPKKIFPIPKLITIISNENNRKIWLPIQRYTSVKSAKNKMAVCVRPLYGPFNDTYAIARFIAYYKTIGFMHFIFYAQEITEQVKMYLLKLFQNKVSIDLLPWFLPSDIQDTWAQGQLACIQDCIYRYMYLFEYILIVDLDERIVPKITYTMQETMDNLVLKDVNKNAGAFMIRHTYFCITKSQKVSHEPVLLIDNVKRMRNIWPSEQRSKLILKPETIEICGIHSVQKMFGGWKQVEIPPQLAILNHYRVNACNKNKNVMYKRAIGCEAMR
ncbi:beta-1,4-galactosyltransferase galt-1-like [Centruroides sculpturatus]|uniref:beta-1,4-galactosyltransferase galt-1-like n=1 Tax=Centruroides sculpturatus TaxID=218467 RepID=UPI000C6E9606|nr:beta-1,4-galactosyltransferase galt-1-like [Centruroides sculpturatus]